MPRCASETSMLGEHTHVCVCVCVDSYPRYTAQETLYANGVECIYDLYTHTRSSGFRLIVSTDKETHRKTYRRSDVRVVTISRFRGRLISRGNYSSFFSTNDNDIYHADESFRVTVELASGTSVCSQTRADLYVNHY